MYCPECGSKNADDALFCGECGKTIEREDLKQDLKQPLKEQLRPIVVQPSKPMSKKNKIILILTIIVVAMAGSCYSLGNYLSKPERIATKYFEEIMSSKWDKAYDYYEIASSTFLSREQFIQSNTKGNQQVANYKVVNNETADYGNKISTTLLIEYRLVGSSDLYTYNVDLIKQRQKQFLFFNKWKVSPDDVVIYDYRLDVPKNTTVVLDGITLSDEFLREADYDYIDSYVIDAMFMGEHEVAIAQENMEDYKEDISISNGGSNFYLDSMLIKEEVKDNIVTRAEELLNTIYQSAISKKSFSEISNLFSSSNEVQSSMEENYNNLKASLTQEDEYEEWGITSIVISNISSNLEQYSNMDQLVVKVNQEYSYEYKYQTKDWWTNEIIKESGSSSDYSSLSFVYEDNKWLLSYIDLNSIYY